MGAALLASAYRVWVIGWITFLEAIRQRLFNFFALVCAALVGASFFLRRFDFAGRAIGSELKFIADFGFGAILFFGSILAIVVTAQLVYTEIENRTALTLLAKPVRRSEFVAGKFLGVWAVLLVFTVIMTVVLAGLIYARETAIMARYPQFFAEGRVVSYADIFIYGLLQWMRFGVLAAATVLVASFSTTYLYTVSVSFFALLIFQLQYIARDAWADVVLIKVLSYLAPNFQVFNVADQLAVGQSLPAGIVARIVFYATAYLLAFNALAVYSFKHREI